MGGSARCGDCARNQKKPLGRMKKKTLIGGALVVLLLGGAAAAFAIRGRRTKHTGHVGRNRADIAFRDARQIADHLRHRPPRNAMIGVPAVAQISKQRIGIPWNGGRRSTVDCIGVPIVDIAAGEWRAGAFGAERVARCVTGAAMRQPFDQIGAAIPFRSLRTVWLIGSATKEQ